MIAEGEQPKDTPARGPQARAELDDAIGRGQSRKARGRWPMRPSQPEMKAGHVRAAMRLRKLAAAVKEARAAILTEPPAS